MIGHFSNVGEPGLKSSRVKVEYPLKKHLFFQVGQFSKVGSGFSYGKIRVFFESFERKDYTTLFWKRFHVAL
ncbi:hypothetical protein VTK56DRAFT_9514 [Thermocarpiscus australiensis]